jgi:hypothetical protein
VQDLHPHDRGPRGTHQGAIIGNGCLYSPATPAPLLQLVALPPAATPAEAAAHDQQTAELSRCKLGLHAAADADGYRRHACPAAAGKVRCPLRPASMKLTRDQPEILAPPAHPPACCTQQTITAGPQAAEKTRQKHDYPSAGWRTSYQRRTAAERLNARIKDAAVNTIDRGWIRLMGQTRSCPGSPARPPSATSAPSPPTRPASNPTSSAPPPRYRPAPANAAAHPLTRPPARRNHAPAKRRRQSGDFHPRTATTTAPHAPHPGPKGRPPRRRATHKIKSARPRECQTQM